MFARISIIINLRYSEMKSIKILASIVLLQFFSGCCKPELIGSYLLTDYQKSMITVTTYHEKIYTDKSGERFVASTQPKETIIYTENPGEEGCKYSDHQRMWTFLNFQSKGFVIKIEIDGSCEACFRLYKIDTGAAFGDWLDLTNSETDLPLKERFTNISVLGFDFKNVLVFVPQNKDSKIKQMLYSPEKGIEFIEYVNGDYFNLVYSGNRK